MGAKVKRWRARAEMRDLWVTKAIMCGAEFAQERDPFYKVVQQGHSRGRRANKKYTHEAVFLRYKDGDVLREMGPCPAKWILAERYLKIIGAL